MLHEVPARYIGSRSLCAIWASIRLRNADHNNADVGPARIRELPHVHAWNGRGGAGFHLQAQPLGVLIERVHAGQFSKKILLRRTGRGLRAKHKQAAFDVREA